MRLRPFRLEDFPELHQIDSACFPTGISYSKPDLAGFIVEHNSKTWVAEEGSEIIGFLIANRTRTGILHIVTIDVREAWRRRGVGETLMDAAEDWGRNLGLRGVSLETAEDNRIAQQFYLKRGYKKLGSVKNYYADGSTAWIMGKRL
jgi:ribosomal-protein-alanine N-acetyltransferase